MFWLLQENVANENGLYELIDVLSRSRISFAVVKWLPWATHPTPNLFGFETENTVVLGSVPMCQWAANHQPPLVPGVWQSQFFAVAHYKKVFGDHYFNWDAAIVSLRDLLLTVGLEPALSEFFVRPNDDTKTFAGIVLRQEQAAAWVTTQVEMHGPAVLNTLVAISSVKPIRAEYRFVIVAGQVVTGSQYRQHGRLTLQQLVDPQAPAYRAATQLAALWPQRSVADAVFMLDLADTENGFRVIELNCFNCAGWYACDPQQIVCALQNLEKL